MNWDSLHNFSKHEFTCNCGCGLNNMQAIYLYRLQWARDIADTMFNINSGTRCWEHNRAVGGSDESDHLFGLGSDIEAISSHDRFKILTSLVKAGFDRIGVYGTFIHAGLWTRDNPNSPNVIWRP